MEKSWEYLVERIPPKEEVARLRELGSLGWELITVMESETKEYLRGGSIYTQKCVKHYFKRLIKSDGK